MAFRNPPHSTGTAGARLGGLTSARVRQLIAAGDLPAERTVAGDYLIAADDVEALAGQRDAAKVHRGRPAMPPMPGSKRTAKAKRKIAPSRSRR